MDPKEHGLLAWAGKILIICLISSLIHAQDMFLNMNKGKNFVKTLFGESQSSPTGKVGEWETIDNRGKVGFLHLYRL